MGRDLRKLPRRNYIRILLVVPEPSGVFFSSLFSLRFPRPFAEKNPQVTGTRALLLFDDLSGLFYNNVKRIVTNVIGKDQLFDLFS